jgi:hypothetical protein
MIFPGLNLKYQFLKQYIHNIKKLLKRQRQRAKDMDDLSLRMALDKSDYYLKHIAKDKNNIFRVFSDSLNFSQSNYKQVKSELYEFIQKNTNTFKNLLKFIGSRFESAEEYLDDLSKGLKEPEIALTMLSYIYKRNLFLLYSDEGSVIKKYKLDLGFKESVFISILDNTGSFDTVYHKEYIKNSGIMQSIIFDVLDQIGDKDKTQENCSSNYKRNLFYK